MLGDLKLLNADGSRPKYSDFNYLKNGTDITDVNVLDDVALFNEVQHVFDDLGFTPDEKHSIYKMIAAVLIFGEIEFDDSTYDENGVACQVKT